LLRAAELLEAYVNVATETNELLQIERVRSSSNLDSLKSLELRCSGLENQVTDLSAALENERLLLDEAIEAATDEQYRLSSRSEEAEAQLPTLQADIQALVQISRLAGAQFKSLADSFRKSGDIVSQVMCEASASALDRLLEAPAAVNDQLASRSQWSSVNENSP
jgi:hypothetical protein